MLLKFFVFELLAKHSSCSISERAVCGIKRHFSLTEIEKPSPDSTVAALKNVLRRSLKLQPHSLKRTRYIITKCSDGPESSSVVKTVRRGEMPNYY